MAEVITILVIFSISRVHFDPEAISSHSWPTIFSFFSSYNGPHPILHYTSISSLLQTISYLVPFNPEVQDALCDFQVRSLVDRPTIPIFSLLKQNEIEIKLSSSSLNHTTGYLGFFL